MSPRSAMPPLEPWDEDGATTRHGVSFSNQIRVLRAIELLRPVAASLAERRPKGWTAYAADIHMRNLQEALARLAPVAKAFERA